MTCLIDYSEVSVEMGAAEGDTVLEVGGKLIDVGGRDVAGGVLFKKVVTVATDGITTDLHQQALNGGRVIFQGCKADDFAKSGAHRQGLAIRTDAGHGVKAIGHRNNSNGCGRFVQMKRVGIAGTVGALVVPANDFCDSRPGELHAADDLVAEGGVVGDFA